MREYDQIPNYTWVLARKLTGSGLRKGFTGWVVGQTDLYYVVYSPETKKEIDVDKKYVFSLSVMDETSRSAEEFIRGLEIDMALDRKDRKRFKELTGG
ncbi:IDEAL domain-containing protein [Halobacillus karajensis]|uniref:IDEAL domain-containing protein n=1 Tax=Halobacillus karajensis TaxID=195088 RepID=A0A059NW98_9BACI|nr:IDEAL domain-containing protein [Halobacillus karajensis]CDQ22588.1 hypothetical protein BN983_00801 [Halobacillus karajensis]CDQ26070.1 hypothetical protein BN981_00281 [Halobacillus karajensis]